MNWYKQQSSIQKEAWDWQKMQKGFWTGIALGLASWLGLSQLEVQNLKQQFNGDDQQVAQVLKEEVEKRGGNPEEIIQQNTTEATPSTEPDINQQKESIENSNENVAENYLDHMIAREGVENTVYQDTSGIPTIGIGHAMGRTPNDQWAQRSQKVFNELFGNTVGWNAVHNGKQSLTDDQVKQLVLYDINEHIERAERIFPKYNTYPEYVKTALLDSVYRGDTGPKTTALINQGRWHEAADEYINRKDYRNAIQNNARGIKIRMDKNRNAMLQYAKELGQ